MRVTFNIDFHTRMGQQVFVVGSVPELGSWDEEKALGLQFENGRCEQTITIGACQNISYRYFVKDFYSNELVYEQGDERKLPFNKGLESLFLKDYWKYKVKDNAVYDSCLFTKVLHKRTESSKTKTDSFTIQIYAPQLKPNESLYISGNQLKFGNWQENKALKLSCEDFPLWKLSLPKETLSFPLEYKYIVKNNQGKLVTWEEGENRTIVSPPSNSSNLYYTDENLRIKSPQWRGAGVSIPVFSLRSYDSYGVGEFLDIKKMVDWAETVGMNIIQVLPINDTTITHTWEDSYPYKPISVFALHPMYLNIAKLKRMTGLEKKQYEEELSELNNLPQVDYELVNKRKLTYAKAFFQKQKKRFLSSSEFQNFFKKNKKWLQAYAAFCYLRDTKKTADFSKWGIHSKYDAKQITKLTDPKAKNYDEIAFFYYLQFHLDKQLNEAVDYARSKNISLKGDIPIGIGGESVDAWQQPQLFNLGTGAGAPPDAFATKGQNWGFPTYNWEEMAKDNFNWWKRRFQKMSDYFDAYRIDHILGFFRIWEIPEDAIWGLLGHFNKALPYSSEELAQKGFWIDYQRHCRPYIREHILHQSFGEQTQYVKEKFLDIEGNNYQFKTNFDTQKKIVAYFEEQEPTNLNQNIREALLNLLTEVLFIADPINPSLFHPRISLHSTASYKELDEHTKHVVDNLYNEFFYHRHDEFWWQQAMDKLPTLVATTDMLVCGEDLGMVPGCVPDVMDRLSILSLEIQRMPKSSHMQFGHPAHAPYLSVCTTSTHDMSTVRAWWEEDRKASQEFYNTILQKEGEAPYFAEPWLCEMILTQHLHSPAMLTIFPLQDLLAINAKLRIQNPEDERINIPSNPKHYWRYRMHISLEELAESKKYNTKLKELFKNSGR